MDLAMMLSAEKRDEPASTQEHPTPKRVRADLPMQASPPVATRSPCSQLPASSGLFSSSAVTPCSTHDHPEQASQPEQASHPDHPETSSRHDQGGRSEQADRPSQETEHQIKRERQERQPDHEPPHEALQEAGAPDNVIAAASNAARRDASASPYSDLQRAVHNALENKTASLSTSDKVALALEVLRARQLELDLAQARNNIEALVTRTGSAPRTLRAVIPASTVKGLPVGTPVEISTGKFLLSPTTNDPQALFLTLELQSFGPPKATVGNTTSDEGAPSGEGARPDRDVVGTIGTEDALQSTKSQQRSEQTFE